MLDNANLLAITIGLPLLGAGLVWSLAPRGRRAVRQSALVTSVLTPVAAGLLVWRFPGGSAPFAVQSFAWLGPATGLNVEFSLGLDGLSLFLFALSALLTCTSVLVSWEAITDRPAAFYGLLLLLEAGMLGVFAARDILLFYVFFEFTLIPLFLIIGIWGSGQRRYAATKFFLYTLAGSLLTFLSLLAIVLWVGQSNQLGRLTFNIAELTGHLAANPMPPTMQLVIFLGLYAGFAIKVPLFPLHTWLPLAHVQAPTAGSVILAGVLLKIGTYGFLRFSMPMLPEATATCVPVLLWLSVAGILYGAMVALAQTDIKRLIAYSSVSHLGYCMLGIFALNRLGMQGGALQMINHGLSTGGLFACVGLLYERTHTREIRELGGLAREMPILAFFMLVFTFSSIGLPGLNGFVGELLVLLGMFQRGWLENSMTGDPQFLLIAILATFGVVLGAWYMLWLIQRTFFGPEKSSESHSRYDPPRDLSLREVAALAPLVVLILWIGLAPSYFLQTLGESLDPTLETVCDEFETTTSTAEIDANNSRSQ